MLKTVTATITAVSFCTTISACGVRDNPLPSGASGAGGEEQTGGVPAQGGRASTGNGGASGTGTAGASGQPNCPEVERAWFTVCWLPDYGDHPSIDGLRVVGPVAPETSGPMRCFPYSYDLAVVPFLAWELEDQEGTRGIVQFSIAGLTSDVLSPGDVVDFKYLADGGGIERTPKGRVALERDGRPVIAIGINEAPYGFVIDPAEAACPEEGMPGCSLQRSARITVADESALVPVGGVADIGGLAVATGYFLDMSNCEFPNGFVPDWLEVGVYTPP